MLRILNYEEMHIKTKLKKSFLDIDKNAIVVDVNGLEPLTLRTSSECSTSWAKRPKQIFERNL